MVPTRVYPRKYIITHRDTSVSSFSWRQTVWEGMKTNNDNTKRQNYFPWVHLKYFASYLMIWIFDCFLYCFMGYIKNESKCWTSLLCVKTSKMYVKKDVHPSLLMHPRVIIKWWPLDANVILKIQTGWAWQAPETRLYRWNFPGWSCTQSWAAPLLEPLPPLRGPLLVCRVWSMTKRMISSVGWGGTLGQHWLLKQFCLNHPVEHIQEPKLPKLYVRVETSTSYFIIHNQFVK